MGSSDGVGAVHVGVGIDTARYGHHVAFLGEDRQEVAKDFTFLESRQGYAELEAALRQIAQRLADAVHFDVRIDAAGQYATNLETFLRRLDLAMTISIGEPKRNRDYKNVHYPKRKADQVDSRACARFAVVERPAASPEVPTAMRRLGEVVRTLSAQRQQITRYINQLHNLLARVFPELATLGQDLSAQWVLEMLRRYPSAKRIGAARALSSIAYLGGERAERIQSAARTSTASLDGPLVETLVEQAVEKVRHSKQIEHTLEELLERAYDELGAGGHCQLITIPGIGKKTAGALAAKIGSIDRFATPQKLVNYFGAFPEENTSGVDKYGKPVAVGTLQMSHKGNDLVRGWLWMACQSGIQCNPALRALYRRERAAGKRGDVALGHCMRKMLHLVFAVWKTNRPFDPTAYAWEEPGEQTAAEPVDHRPERTALACPPAPATVTNELATRCAPRPAAAGIAESAREAAVALTRRPVALHACAEQAVPPKKKTAGRKEALPRSQAVTAATNELATRTLPGAGEPSNPVWVDFAHVRRQISLEQVLSKLGIFDRLHGRGPQRRGPCPIHGSEGHGGRPFSVHLGKNVFRCLNAACGKQGNALDLWSAVRQLPLRQATIDLADAFHLQLAPAAASHRVKR